MARPGEILAACCIGLLIVGTFSSAASSNHPYGQKEQRNEGKARLEAYFFYARHSSLLFSI